MKNGHLSIYLSLDTATRPRRHSRQVSAASFSIGIVSGSGTGPLDYGATGPVPDTEPRL